MPNLPVLYQEKKHSKFEDLLHGGTVTMQVQDRGSKVKGRNPVLFISPLNLYIPAAAESKLLFSYEGGGSWVVDTYPKVKAIDIYKAGVPITLAKLLAEEINQVLKR